MAKVIRKLESGDDLLGYELDTEINTTKGIDGKGLGDYEIEIIGSSGATDRDGESLDPKGADLKAFKKNPVILPQHDYRKPAIGKAKNIKVVDGKIVFKIEFPEEGVNPEADVYRKLYKSGFMNASSVGFIPKEWKDNDKEPYRTYTKWGLLELSLVSVPANAEALVTQRSFVSKGIISEDEAKSIGWELEEKVAKGNDPAYAYSEEHLQDHKDLKEGMSNIEKRLVFIEGFITGLQKEATDEAVEQKSYIAKLLSVDCAARTEDQTDSNEAKSVDVEEIKKLF